MDSDIRAPFVSPQVLMAIKNLELRARIVVQGFWNGLHRSPYHGFSVEFTEYRPYTQNDDPRHVDWRVYARTDRYYIKKFEDETNLRCHLLVDRSRSMSYGSLAWTKADYAATLAATVAHFLHQQGDAVGLLTFDEQIRDYLPARSRRSHLRQLMLTLEKAAGGRATDLAAPLRRIVELVRKRCLMVFITDLLAPLATLEQDIARLVACGHEVLLFQVLDPAELTFDFTKASLFRDVECERDLYIDPGAARAGYLRNLEAHTREVRRICDQLGVSYHPLSSATPLEHALFEFLRSRMRRSRIVRRNAGPA